MFYPTLELAFAIIMTLKKQDVADPSTSYSPIESLCASRSSFVSFVHCFSPIMVRRDGSSVGSVFERCSDWIVKIWFNSPLDNVFFMEFQNFRSSIWKDFYG